MGLGVEEAVAMIIRDGDPARSIDGLDTLYGYRLYDDASEDARRIFVAEEPDQPDESVTVVLEGGAPPTGGGPPNAVGRSPAFSVRCRAASYARAQQLAHEVYAVLDWFEGLVRGVPFFRILANFEPIPLGRDRDDRAGRWIFTQTYRSTTKRYGLS